ncbi:IS21-like element IS1326 family transposase [Bacillota bacterium]
MEKHTIIQLKQQGKSNRQVAAMLGIDRKTVAKYWNEFKHTMEAMGNANAEVKLLQESIASPPTYDVSTRKGKKYTKEIDDLLNSILKEEERKDHLLGNHKQRLTQTQIHQKIRSAGYDIGSSTISIKIKQKRDKQKECFIRQKYDLGDRLEYDFGEVKLEIANQIGTFHMAVLSSPAGDFRWAYLYKNQKQDVFIESQVRFFDMVGGCYREVVYDNMKNVVSKFIGRNEKELNQNLLLLANYYGFQINVTNCFKGNEKGHVESSVKIIRNKVFAEKYSFSSFEEACEYLQNRLVELSADSNIKEESKHLLPRRPKLELGRVNLQKVNTYSFVQIDKNFYSVPDYLVGRKVITRTYVNKVKIYSNNIFVCEHKKVDGVNEISIDIKHYLSSLTKKPGALKNSLALKSIPQLKAIYDNHFNTNPRKFIELMIENKDKSIEQVIHMFSKYDIFSNNVIPIDSVPSQEQISRKTKQQTERYNSLCIAFKKEAQYEN